MEAQLQEVVSSLGGKVRSNQLMALIQGYGTYTDMIETYKGGALNFILSPPLAGFGVDLNFSGPLNIQDQGPEGADKELEIYLNGWEAKSNRLVNQWTQFGPPPPLPPAARRGRRRRRGL